MLKKKTKFEGAVNCWPFKEEGEGEGRAFKWAAGSLCLDPCMGQAINLHRPITRLS